MNFCSPAVRGEVCQIDRVTSFLRVFFVKDKEFDKMYLGEVFISQTQLTLTLHYLTLPNLLPLPNPTN